MVYVRLDGKVLLCLESAEGEVEIGGKRYRVVREITKPEELIRVDPLAALALMLGLEQCPWHPEVWLRPGEPCQACVSHLVTTVPNPAWEKEEAK